MNPIVLMIVNMLLPTMFDVILAALEEVSKKTDNEIDDKMIAALRGNKTDVIEATKIVAKRGK